MILKRNLHQSENCYKQTTSTRPLPWNTVNDRESVSLCSQTTLNIFIMQLCLCLIFKTFLLQIKFCHFVTYLKADWFGQWLIKKYPMKKDKYSQTRTKVAEKVERHYCTLQPLCCVEGLLPKLVFPVINNQPFELLVNSSLCYIITKWSQSFCQLDFFQLWQAVYFFLIIGHINLSLWTCF